MGHYTIPIGERTEAFSARNVLGVVQPRQTSGVSDVHGALLRAAQDPIGSESLQKIAAGKSSAAIVVNDITRPYPGKEMVAVLAQLLNEAGIPDSGIKLIMAYGHHRDNTREELRGMFGAELLGRFEIVHHHAGDPNSLEFMGVTSMGIPVEVNKVFARSEVKITTGCITPHQLAGFSGGRKSILPGISGMNALKKHHSFPIRPDRTSLGWLEGNPFHHQAVEAARIAGVDFILNSIDNAHREVVSCVAGDLEAAYAQGVALCRRVWAADVPEKADIVVVSPGGYPRDFDLHQSQKALGCAEMLCRPGGTIILCAEMRDGAGRPGAVLEAADSPESVIAEFRKTGYTPQALSKAYMLARALRSFHVCVAGSMVPAGKLEAMFFTAYKNVDDAVRAAVEEQGENASVLIVPYASDILPTILSRQCSE